MMETPSVLDAYAGIDLFRSLRRRELDRVVDAAHTTHHEAGKEIASQGDNGIAFHLILDGVATVTVEGRAPHDIGPGDYFGEVSMIDGLPRSATVTAKTPLTTSALTSWEFRPMLKQMPEIALALLPVLCGRLRQSELPT